jgi:type I restriction-modification system DNA methylase subunit
MANFVTGENPSILEPTPGEGNLVRSLEKKGTVTAPQNIFSLPETSYDWVVANPPFTPMKVGYQILDKCLEISDNLVFLLPWLVIINSERRTRKLQDFGLVSVTHLPRKAFNGARVQTCILELKKGYTRGTRLHFYRLGQKN